MVRQFSSDWVLDLDTGDVVYTGNLFDWGDTYLQMNSWAATVEGFCIGEDAEEVTEIEKPDGYTSITVDMKTLIEMYAIDRVVCLEERGDTLHRVDAPT
jgi:hypothetical protein